VNSFYYHIAASMEILADISEPRVIWTIWKNYP